MKLPDGLSGAFAAAGAAAWGGTAYGPLEEHMAPIAREKARALCPGASAVLVAAFPYYAGEEEGNLSLYARGEDYHRVLGRRLNTICTFLSGQYPSYRFIPGADSSPLPEREAAWAAGIGLRGKNGLVILPPYGSYLFLGTILTDCPFEVEARPAAPDCLSCGACAAACPTGALGLDGRVEVSRCLSDLTQRKGEVSAEEGALLRAHSLIWGCDRCQTVCPYNRAAALTPLPEFREGLLPALTSADLAGLTGRSFQAKYGGRAFAWRGPGPLRRNLALKEE